MDIFAKISNKDYDVKEIPVRPKKPFLKKDQSPSEIRAYADDLEAYEKSAEEYKTALQNAQKIQKGLREQFKKDAIEYAGLCGHEAANRAFDHAWDRSHDAGLAAVVDELVDLSTVLTG